METITDRPVRKRIFGLDILRFCAIIFVVAAHGRFLAQDTILYEFPYIVFTDGVDLFFALSGFLIGSILLKEIHGANSFNGSQLLHFWKRRWFRTLPNYYLVLALNFIVIKSGWVNGDISQFNWKFLFFLQNFSWSFFGFFLESWSLSVEEWFYIFAPIMLMGLVKFLSLKRAFLMTVILLIVMPVLFRYLKFVPGADWSFIDVEIKKVVVTRFDSIGYGLLAAWYAFYYAGSWKRYRFVCLGLAVVLYFIMKYYNESGNSFYIQVIYFSLSPLMAMFLLPLAHSIKTVKGFVAKGVTYISKISYSMYLVNLGIVSEFIRLNFLVHNTTDGIIKYFLYWAIVIILSGIIYRFFEKPVMNLRDKFS